MWIHSSSDWFGSLEMDDAVWLGGEYVTFVWMYDQYKCHLEIKFKHLFERGFVEHNDYRHYNIFIDSVDIYYIATFKNRVFVSCSSDSLKKWLPRFGRGVKNSAIIPMNVTWLLPFYRHMLKPRVAFLLISLRFFVGFYCYRVLMGFLCFLGDCFIRLAFLRWDFGLFVFIFSRVLFGKSK